MEFSNSNCWGDIINKDTGVVEGKSAMFLAIDNYGIVNVDHCTMKGELKSFGLLNAVETTFQKNVTIGDGQAMFDNCKLENLFIKDDSENPSSLPQVTLIGSSKISGSIVFTTGQGNVYKGPKVEIVGQVINGSIINLDE